MHTQTTSMDLSEFMRQHRAKNNAPEKIQDMEYISVEEYAQKMHVSADAVRKRLREGKIANAIKDGKRWMIGIVPTFSREEYDKIKLENAELKNTLRILKSIISERVV